MQNKEEITNIFYFPAETDIRENVIEFGDSDTLIKYKIKHPFKLFNTVTVCVQTTKRNFSFTISKGFVWNGADIPRFLWFVGSRTDNQFLISSMIHDYLLNNKFQMMNENLNGNITPNKYRRLTSLIFREILKATGTNKIKANVMSFFVDCWQRLVFSRINTFTFHT